MSKIEITTSAARDLLPCMEARVEELQLQIQGMTHECHSLEATVAELKARLNSADALPVANSETDGARLRKGAGEQAVFQLLSNLPKGQKLTVAEIVKRTGVKQPTVYRTLTEPKRNKGRFVQEGNEWRIK